MYKYRNTTVPENSNNTYLTPLQLSWNSYLSISSMIPNVSFLFINAFLGKDALKKGQNTYWGFLVNLKLIEIHIKKGLDHSGAGSDSSGAFLGSQGVE